MNIPAYVGWRYYRSSAANRFVSLVTLVSFLGLALGVAALIVVVSVMNGFDRELKERLLGVTPHVLIADSTVSEVRAEPLLQDVGVDAVTPFQAVQVMLVTRNGSHLLTLQGIDPLQEPADSVLVKALPDEARTGLRSDSRALILGRAIARRFDVQPGDTVNLVLPAVSASGANLSTRLFRALVIGTFQLGSEMDYRLGILHVAQTAAMSGETADARLSLTDLFAAPALADKLRSKGYEARSWTSELGDFFQAVWMEKVMMFVLLSFVVAIASSSIVSGLAMLVETKRGDIAVLRTLGMTESDILKVFLIQGMGIASLGVAVGCVTGIFLTLQAPAFMGFVEDVTGFSIIAGTYFDQIPTDIRWPDLCIIAALTFAISFAATLYPSYRAAKLHPAEVLRYE